MKNLLLFVFFILIGIGISIGYFTWSKTKIKKSNIAKHEKKEFSIEKAPSESLRGTITSMSGEVQWQSRIATEPAKLNDPHEIQQGEELIASNGAKLTLEFQDSTKLTIFPDSHLSIIQTLPTNMVFSQPKGKILYEKLGKSPVSIRSLHLVTLINEGSLELSIDEENSEIRANVLEGSAQIAYNDLELLSHVETVKKNQIITFNDVTRDISVEDLSQ